MTLTRSLFSLAALSLAALTAASSQPVLARAGGHAASDRGTIDDHVRGIRLQPDSVPQATIDDQVEVALTVYNSNLALVRDVRDLRLPPGTFDLRFVDIAATVNPATVHLRSLSEPARVGVLEQNYEYDLLEPEKLLRKYVGREVTLVRTRTDNGQTRDEEVKAQLVSLNNGPIWKIGNEYVTGLQASALRFPELPDNLYSRPTLVWSLSNRGGPSHRLEASYLATGLAWSSDYVLTIGRDEKGADLDGWVTLANQSGTGFKDARLQLVAGDLHRVQTGARDEMLAASRVLKAAAEAPAMVQEAFSEYHLYTLGRKTTISNNQTKQLSLLTGTGIPVAKRFVVDGQHFYYRNAQHPGAPLKDRVRVFYRFRNDEASGLGSPMPAGTIRVYQADSRGGIHFVGEDRVGHTPKDEAIDLEIGSAFDVVCERKQTDFDKVATDVYEVEYEVTLRNHKVAPISVQVNEPLGGTWRMLRSSHEWRKTEAWAAQFDVPVAADGTSVLKYRVRIEY